MLKKVRGDIAEHHNALAV